MSASRSRDRMRGGKGVMVMAYIPLTMVPDLSVLIDFAAQMVSSGIALAGVFIGAHIANKAAIRQERLNVLRMAYANVFKSYAEWILTQDTQQLAQLLPTIYEARLLSEADVDASLQKLADAVTQSSPNAEQCSTYLQEFWKRAQKEICKGYRQ